jgi:hypothetical protein
LAVLPASPADTEVDRLLLALGAVWWLFLSLLLQGALQRPSLDPRCQGAMESTHSNQMTPARLVTQLTVPFAPRIRSCSTTSCLAARLRAKSGSQLSAAGAGATKFLHPVTRSPAGGFAQDSGSPRPDVGRLIRLWFVSRGVCGLNGTIGV